MDIHYIVAPPDGWRCMEVSSTDGEIHHIKLMMKDGTVMHDLTGFPITVHTIADLEQLLRTQMPGFTLISGS